LNGGSGFAWLPIVQSVLRDVAKTVLLAAALCARTPVAPIAPFAIYWNQPIQASPRVARCGRHERPLAHFAIALSFCKDSAVPGLLAWTATGAAFGPRAPIAQTTIHVYWQDRAPWGFNVASIDLVLWARTEFAISITVH